MVLLRVLGRGGSPPSPSPSKMSTDCSKTIDSYCRNSTTALHLKIGALAAILVSSALGVLMPMVGKRLPLLRTDSDFFFVTKAFAAGVILATGFCHMLPDANAALSNPCLPTHPWSTFPWQGFIPMIAALGTLVIDFLGTEYYERKHGFTAHGHGHGHGLVGETLPQTTARINNKGDLESLAGDSGIITEKGCDIESKEMDDNNSNSGQMHIVGMRAHAASHSHSHADGHHGTAEAGHLAGHHHVPKDASPAEVSLRHVVISQVLELGIVAHSILIGLALGVSESPCTIRPLMVALVFHQFFEGFALGGCISQAGFKRLSAGIMALFFAITTPFGICLGLGIANTYNENSPTALITEGIFDAISAGILIYMALVDLIAADFLSKRLRCDRRLQIFSYVALFAGAGAMSVIAIWA